MNARSFSRNILSLSICLLVISVASAQSRTKEVKELEAIQRLEEKYWNAGDIDGYVSLYAPGDSTRMIYYGGSGVTYGRDSILAFYKKYWPKEKMGHLTLDGQSYERLSSEYYYVSGFFHVTYTDRKQVNGRFSGLMKKVKGKWYLYTDHSGN